MTLTTHIIIAAAVARPLAHHHPAFAFLAALASHYVSDAIPHWDYNPFPKKTDEWDPHSGKIDPSDSGFLAGILRIAADACTGSLALFLILQPETLQEFIYMATVIVGGVLPDFLQGLYGTRRFEYLKLVQRFHDFIHSKIKLGPYPLIGIPLQLLIILISLFYLY